MGSNRFIRRQPLPSITADNFEQQIRNIEASDRDINVSETGIATAKDYFSQLFAQDQGEYFTVSPSSDEISLFYSYTHYYRFGRNAVDGSAVANPDATNPTHYQRVDIEPSTNSYPGLDSEGNPITRTYSQELQNFANWFQYYRTRWLLSRAVMSEAFYQLPDYARVGIVNQRRHPNNFRQTTSFNAAARISDPVALLSQTYKSVLVDYVQEKPETGFPDLYLSESLKLAGHTVLNELSDTGLWSDSLGQPSPEENPYACRRNHAVILADTSDVYHYPASRPALIFGEVDNQTGPSYEGYQYTPGAPYKNASVTLADGAMAYWGLDLRSEQREDWGEVSTFISGFGEDDYSANALPNTLPTTDDNPATWQHMQTHVFGWHFGHATGEVYPNGLSDVAAGNKSWKGWGQYQDCDSYGCPDFDTDVLYHATINGHGRFRNDFLLNSDQPGALPKAPDLLAQDLAEAIMDLIHPGKVTTTVTAALGLESVTSPFTAHLFQAQANQLTDEGDLVAFAVNDEGDSLSSGIVDTANPVWSAAEQLASVSADQRHVFSAKIENGSATGIVFDWDSLDAAQQAQLNQQPNGTVDSLGQARVNWLRGETQQAELRRLETPLLGDIVHSRPVYVATPEQLYPDSLESAPYSEFKTQHADRDSIVYVGANDGMLHGFYAEDLTDTDGAVTRPGGREAMGFVPSSVYAHLNQLSDPGYQHHYYVDGSPVVKDVFYDGAWHTLLVGNLGRGGQGVFALDITDPDTFSDPSKASEIVRWELTSETLSDTEQSSLGTSTSNLLIERTNSGDWMVLTGNGYNSTSGDAQLLVIDAETGNLTRSIPAVVSVSDPTSVDRPNGLTGVTPLDIDGDYDVDFVYAGDVYGNIWRFDLTDSSVDNWSVTQVVDNQRGQTVAYAPYVGLHPSGHPFIIFATGQLLDNVDVTDTQVQTVYGVQDTDSQSPLLLDANLHLRLEAQVFTEVPAVEPDQQDSTTNNTGQRVRQVSANAIGTKQGWYIDLPEAGERTSAAPQVVRGRLFIGTHAPHQNICQPGEDAGFVLELNPLTGGPLAEPVRDINADGQLSAEDRISVIETDVERAYGAIETISGVPSSVVSFFSIDTNIRNQFEQIDLAPGSTPETTGGDSTEGTSSGTTSSGGILRTSFVCFSTGAGEIVCQESEPNVGSGDPVSNGRQLWRDISNGG